VATGTRLSLTMSPPPSLSQRSRLGDNVVLTNAGIEFDREGLAARLAPENTRAKLSRLPESRGSARRRRWEEQQARDEQLLESSRLARRRAQEELQARDNELLESYSLEKLRHAEQRRELRIQQDRQRRRSRQARDDSTSGTHLQHKDSSVDTMSKESLKLTEGLLRN
jgi:hypothetical protein